MEGSGSFRVGFVAGVTPDKWAGRWAERMPRQTLALVPLVAGDGVAQLHDGELHMCFVRLPVDRAGLHLIPLYDEQPVVLAQRDNPVAAYDEIGLEELSGEEVLRHEDVGSVDIVASLDRVAADAALLVVPMSVARLHRRRDMVSVPLTGEPPTTVGLAWRRELDDDRVETFVGIVRGRTANSSRGR